MRGGKRKKRERNRNMQDSVIQMLSLTLFIVTKRIKDICLCITKIKDNCMIVWDIRQEC
jgi:hypothetical protein